MIVLSDNDAKTLKAKYPELKLHQGILEGKIRFCALLLGDELIIEPTPNDLMRQNKRYEYIYDDYDLRIVMAKNSPFPHVYEVGGKIINTAKRLGKTRIDMHMYSNDTLCVASSMQLDKEYQTRFDIVHYIDNYVIPFLFAQSYYAAHETWPWGELLHGYKGLLQWLGSLGYDAQDSDIELTYAWMMRHDDRTDAEKALGKRWRGHEKCICDSGKKMRDCHPEIKFALSSIRSALRKGVITPHESTSH